MTDEEYKQLILFYLIDFDTSGYLYAAVDENGSLYLYKGVPILYQANNKMWTLTKEIGTTDDTLRYLTTGMVMPLYDNWNKVVVKL